MRGKTREELREICIALRDKKPAQAAILEAMLPVKKGILLSQASRTNKRIAQYCQYLGQTRTFNPR